MKQTIITSLIILVITGLLSVIVLGSRDKNITNKKTVFFYGNTCPHCTDVEEWIKENKIEEKITIVKKEVYDNQQNALELNQAATNCGLPTDSIGVPFLYAEGKCITGTSNITSYLSEITGISKAIELEERDKR